MTTDVWYDVYPGDNMLSDPRPTGFGIPTLRRSYVFFFNHCYRTAGIYGYTSSDLTTRHTSSARPLNTEILVFREKDMIYIVLLFGGVGGRERGGMAVIRLLHVPGLHTLRSV